MDVSELPGWEVLRERLERFNFGQYGPSYQDVWDIWILQRGKCALCAEALTPKFHVDHDHDTGGVRGFVCPFCNTQLIGSNTLGTALKLVQYLSLEQHHSEEGQAGKSMNQLGHWYTGRPLASGRTYRAN